MAKPILFLALLFTTIGAFAQKMKADTVVYYLKSSGKTVSIKDSADFFLVILPPDTNVDKNLFVVNEFYASGKTRLIGNSISNNLNLTFQGSQITFFPNGRKMKIADFEKGKPVGDAIEYYPNGKLYNIKSYLISNTVYFKQLNDTTGVPLTEDGNGTWKIFDDNFNKIIAEGAVKDGMPEGQWKVEKNKYEFYIYDYKSGNIVTSNVVNKQSADSLIVTKFDVPPVFRGGLEAFGHYLGKTIRYPLYARDHNIQGRVIVGFVVERDGTITNVKLVRGVGGGCDEESIRVMELSPPWNPAMQNGKPVRVFYSVPISYTLDNHN